MTPNSTKVDPTSMQQLIRAGADRADASPDRIARALHAIRTHLGMDVAFVSEFVDGQRVFRHVDASSALSPVQVGGADPLEDSYCQRVVDGRLPELIRDAAAEPEAAALPATAALPVGAHVSVPIRLRDGHVYGTFCCFSRTPDHSLTDRDLAVMRVLADLTADRIDDERRAHEHDSASAERLRAVIAGDGLFTALQPIIDLSFGTVVGYEGLARFAVGTPDIWFAQASKLGWEVELDLAALGTSVGELAYLPEDAFLALNVVPATVTSGRLNSALADLDLRRVVLEITEHAAIESYEALAEIITPLRGRGLRVAVDDAGAGYASFRHILRLDPDFIKLDMSLTRDIDQDPARRALATALIGFARDTHSIVIAEGVETPGELDTLRELGVPTAQGYHLGRPERPARQARSRPTQPESWPDLAARSG